jgi:hypothetical protein
MGIGVSIVLFAVGAVLDWGISVSNTHGFNIHTIGIILMIVGVVGFVLSLLFWGSWGGFGGSSRRDVVIDRGAGVGSRRVVEEDRF